jgi:hypothetical protein
MRVSTPAPAMMTPSHLHANAELLEPRWPASSGEHEVFAEEAVNHSANTASYDSSHGVCNELARIALNRSAVMQAYDSMFPRSGVPRAATRRKVEAGWLRRAMDALRGRR